MRDYFVITLAFFLQVLLYVSSTAGVGRCPSTFKPAPGECLVECLYDNDCQPNHVCCQADRSNCYYRKCVPLTKCQLEKLQKFSTIGQHGEVVFPTCRDDGHYKEMCVWRRGVTRCWQVEPITGTKVSEVRVELRQPSPGIINQHVYSPDDDEEGEEEQEEGGGANVRRSSKCTRKRKRRMSLRIFKPRVFVPECKRNGAFKRAQCKPSSDRCWCVDRDGKEIRGTKIKGKKPSCKHDQCGRKFYKRRRRIVGGSESAKGAWPWQAALFLNGTQHRCGGALIKSQWIVTAAHCFNRHSSKNPANWQVRLGEHSFLMNDRTEKYLGVREIRIHPNYIPGNFSHPGDHDIALIRLSRSVKLGRSVNSICMPENFKFFKPGKRCVIAGWGKTAWNGSVSPVLREAWVDLVSRTDCNSQASYGGKIGKRFLCAGYKEGGIDACAYDSGGPLMCPGDKNRWLLAGIVSWGEKCALPNKYGVYTNVHEFLPWIRGTMKLDR